MIPCLIAAPAIAQTVPGAGSNFETRLSGIEDDMRNMNGQVEQLGYAIRRLDQTVQRMQTDYDARLAKLETAVATLSANDDARSAADRAAAATAAAKAAAAVQQQAQTPPAQPTGPIDGTLGAIKTQPDGRVTGAINNPQAPALPDTPPDYGLTAQEEYERAMGMLRQADYDGAEKSFQSFIDKFPKDKMVDNAKYWHAETLYVRGKFLDAASGFADAYQQNPQGSKAPDSLLKLSMSLEGLNKTSEACASLKQLKLQFPNASSSIRSRAAEERSKLKCNAT
jgi:tol-pal system protein YbgF